MRYLVSSLLVFSAFTCASNAAKVRAIKYNLIKFKKKLKPFGKNKALGDCLDINK